METLRLLVRNIVILVLLAAFLEMLLPLRETRRFVEVIVGLFVLVAILNPIVDFLRQEPLFDPGIFQSVGADEQVEAILARGEELQGTAAVEARAAYGKRLEDQIKVVARLVPGVGDARVKVDQSSDSSLQAVGVVNRVWITIMPEKNNQPQAVAPVEKVHIPSGAGGSASGTEQLKAQPGGEERLVQVQETIASFFGLREDQVIVNWEEL